MKFYYHKLGTKNVFAQKWLEQGNSPLGKPAIAIFWGRITKTEIAKRKLIIRSRKQAYDFYEASLAKNRKKTIIILIFSSKIWFVQPIGQMVQHTPRKNAKDIYKLVPVKIIKTVSLKEVPSILAGITANAYIGRGTFREITNWGNIKSIYKVLNKSLPKEHLVDNNLTLSKLLECLGSVELETLVAKIFEDNGCFVPAYRGGNLKDIDLFVANTTKKDKDINGLKIKANKTISIQVKGKIVDKCPANVDHFIGYDSKDVNNCFDSNWILKNVIEAKNKHLSEWFKQSLSWLPKEFSNNYEFLK